MDNNLLTPLSTVSARKGQHKQPWWVVVQHWQWSSYSWSCKSLWYSKALSILVRKLQALGVTGLDLDWFISYLDNWQQQVFFNGLLSSTEHILSGASQGSALGPLLFLVYINDLPSCISHSSVNMFADDTALYYSSNNTDEILRRRNDDLESISRWIKLNGLVLNPKKCEFMVIGSPQRLNHVQFGTLMLNGSQ